MTSSPSSRSPGDRPTQGETVLIVVAGTCLSCFFVLAWMVQPQEDDWQWALRERTAGWLGAQVESYRHFDGHLVATALQTLLGVGDPVWVSRVGAAAIVAAWVAASVGLARAVVRAAQGAAVGLALAACAGLCATAALNEFFYWFSAAVTYPLAAAFAMTAAAIAVRGARGLGGGAAPARWSPPAAFLAALLATGCGESIIPLAGLMVGWGWWWQRREPHAHAHWGACAAGLAIGTVIEVVAPGNAEKAAGFGGPHPLAAACLSSLAVVAWGLWSLVRHPAMVAAMILCAPLAAAVVGERGSWRTCAAMVAMAVAGSCAAALPVEIAYGEMVDRVFDLIRWWQWMWLLPAGCVAWRCARPALARWGHGPYGAAVPAAAAGMAGLCLHLGWGWISWALIACAAVAGMPGAGRRAQTAVQAVILAAFAASCLVQAGPDLFLRGPRWHAVWRERVAAMVAARDRGERVVVIPALPDDGYPDTLILIEVPANPRYFWTKLMARWYGVGEIWLDCRLPPGNAVRAHWEAQVRARARTFGQTTLGGIPFPGPGPVDQGSVNPAP
jgi:hypothetical protein